MVHKGARHDRKSKGFGRRFYSACAFRDSLYFMEVPEVNYWGGVICGCCAASLFFVVMMFVSVEQTNRLREEVAQLREKVAEHEEVIRQYEFYVWHNMKFFEESEK